MNTDTTFGDFYEYTDANGSVSVIPDVNTLRTDVENGFKGIFGSDFSTLPGTPNAVLVDAITLMMFNTLGIISQNINGLNVNAAVSSYLDALGEIFGVGRDGDTDDDYRKRILASQSRGSGTSLSVRQALSQLPQIKGFCVLDNGYPFSRSLPEGEANAISVSPHSIYVSVAYDEEYDEDVVKDEISKAIYATKAAGCGYSDTSTPNQEVTVEFTDSVSQSKNTVKFVKAEKMTGVGVSVVIDMATYSGADVEGDVKAAIKKAIASRPMSVTISKPQMIASIAEFAHCTATSIEYSIGGSPNESLVVFPFQYIDVDDEESVSISVVGE